MVNIIKFEFRKNIISLLVWAISAIMLSFVYLSVFPTFSDAALDVEALLSTYPPAMLESLNINLEYISTMEGYYPMVVGFVQLVAFAFSATLTLKIFCMEYKNKSVEFLLAKPRSRTTFFNAKIITILLMNTLFFVLVSAASYGIIQSLTEMSFKNFMIIQATIYIIMILAMFLTSIFAVIFSKVRGYDGIGFIIAFAFYAINILASILEEAKLSYLSLYGIFDFNELFMDGYNITTLIVLAVISILSYVIALTIYRRKDVL